MTRSIICILIPMSLIVCCYSVHAASTSPDITVQAQGVGVSKSDALLHAKRNAVEKGIGTVLISQTEMKNFTIQKDIVLTQTIGAIKQYRILSEQTQSDGNIELAISALVSINSIKKDLAALKILLESMDKPRMMVLIQGSNGDSAQNAIIEYLSEKKVDLIDPAMVAALKQKQDNLVIRATRGDPAAAAQIGADNGAEYIMVGSIANSTAQNEILANSGMVSGQADITAKVINCSNANIIASRQAHAAAVHISKQVAQTRASVKAAHNLMDQSLFEQIVTSFADMVNNGMMLDVYIHNVTRFKQQKEITALIETIPDVVGVHKRSFGKGILNLSIQFKGNADVFSEKLDGLNVNDKKMSVTDIVGSRVESQLE